jgi:hypothetical protein
VIFTLVFLFVLGVILYPAIKASLSAKPDIPENLDLRSVRDAVMEKQGWSRERAEAARTEYVRFLTLLQMKPGFMPVPWPNAEGQDDHDNHRWRRNKNHSAGTVPANFVN